MQIIPWQQISDWRCTSCGNCCREYSVILDFQEWLGIVKNFGVEFTGSSLDKLFVRRRNDGSCAFLNNGSATCFCGLQHMKPRACQLWPFKICSRPIYGSQSEALFSYRGKPLYIYADNNCRGLVFGRPTSNFATLKLTEFIEIALRIRSKQLRTTGSPWHPSFSPNFEHWEMNSWY
jgi:Fe-S-cluster containining protein